MFGRSVARYWGMGRVLVSVLLGCGLAAAARGQGGAGCCGNGMGPASGAPLVDVYGTISQVRIAPGQGMPSIVVKSASSESTILLGPLRYLMARNFNPKVGEEVVVKAYKTPMGLIAATITLPQAKKTLRLRDDDGLPLWRGGRW